MSEPDVKQIKKATERALLDAVGSRLTPHGFAKRRGWSFLRGIEGGRQAVHLAMINYKGLPSIEATVDIAIRFDALEDLINAASRSLSETEKKQTFSLGCELGNLRDGRQHPWESVGLEEVPLVAGSMVRLVEEVGLPFFDRFSAMDEALRGLQDPKWDPLESTCRHASLSIL